MASAEDEAGYLSAAGVEFAAVLVLLFCRAVNLVQLATALPGTAATTRHPGVDVALGFGFLLTAAVVALRSVRERRLRACWLLADIVASAVCLLAMPFLLDSGQLVSWAAWPYPVSLLTLGALAATGRVRATVLSTGLLLTCYLSWLWRGVAVSDRTTLVTDAISFPAFAVVLLLFLSYLRRLAALADAGREATRRVALLEAEAQTRRALHTPHALLRELEGVLLDRATDHLIASEAGSIPAERASLAEVRASLREIEALVRGVTPATGNLHAELHALADQFQDLPLVVEVDDLSLTVDPHTSYRLREAVRSALQNVRAHSHATQVTVFGSDDDGVGRISVYDNGTGMDPASERRLGTSIIVDGPAEVGWVTTVVSSRGNGTFIEFVQDSA